MTGDVAGLSTWARKLSGALGKEALGDVKCVLAFKQTKPRPNAQMFPNFFARWLGSSKGHFFEFVGVFPAQVCQPPQTSIVFVHKLGALIGAQRGCEQN
jgi:hypothetical protein